MAPTLASQTPLLSFIRYIKMKNHGSWNQVMTVNQRPPCRLAKSRRQPMEKYTRADVATRARTHGFS